MMATSRHFNDLLMKLRGLALPLVVGAGGVVTSAKLNGELPLVPLWVLVLIPLALGVSGLLAVGLAAHHTPAGTSGGPSASAHSLEWDGYRLAASMPLLTAVGMIGWAICVNGHSSAARVRVPLQIPLVFLAVLTAVTVYLLDRYYYFRLLIGAVLRAEALEHELGFGLTSSITEATPDIPSRLVVTALYGVPIIVGLLGLMLALIVISGQS